MKRIGFIILIFLLCVSCFSWTNSLKPKGKSYSIDIQNIQILIPDKPLPTEIRAGEDLSKYLSQIYGKDFKVIKEEEYKEGNFISLGKTKAFYESGFSNIKLELEGYGIETKDNNLYIFGGERRGPIYGVYALLEEDLGCRFWTRKKDYTIPTIKGTKLSFVPREYNPPFDTRHPGAEEAFDEDFAFINRANPLSQISFEAGHYLKFPTELGNNTDNTWICHTSFNFVTADMFDEHPEYFGEYDGVRKAWSQLCWSNQDVIDITTKKLIQFIKDTNADIVGLSPQDGTPLCDCEKCRALDEKEGTKAATLFKALNEIIERTNEVYPNVKILTLAYLDYVKAPKTIKPNKNILIFVCSDNSDWPFPFCDYNETEKYKENVKNWIDVGGNVITWNYVSNYSHWLMPMPNITTTAKNLRILRDLGVGGVFLQGNSYPNTIRDEGYMKAWVWSKLLWNPDLDEKALRKDFIEGYYGKAAKYIWEYDCLLNDLYYKNHKKPHNVTVKPYTTEAENPIMTNGIRISPEAPLFTKQFVEKSIKCLEKAMEVSKDDSELYEKVKTFKASLNYFILARDLGVLQGNGSFKPSTEGMKYDVEFYQKIYNELDDVFKAENVKAIGELHFSWNNNKDPLMNKWKAILYGENKTAFGIIKEEWNFSTDPDNIGETSGYADKSFDSSSWKKIKSGEYYDGTIGEYIGTSWYRRIDNISAEEMKAENIYYIFGACDEEATVYVNGKKVLEHTCESLNLTPEQIWLKPFIIDIKPYVTEGENIISVKVYNAAKAGGLYQLVYRIVCQNKMTEEEAMKIVF
ncbi:MAG: DUF4838 domain-containing protein [Abditibacteriota bacterium]|nr:DUF4838 domain-containing protein [Abditibacteriota bacterium]